MLQIIIILMALLTGCGSAEQAFNSPTANKDPSPTTAPTKVNLATPSPTPEASSSPTPSPSPTAQPYTISFDGTYCEAQPAPSADPSTPVLSCYGNINFTAQFPTLETNVWIGSQTVCFTYDTVEQDFYCATSDGITSITGSSLSSLPHSDLLHNGQVSVNNLGQVCVDFGNGNIVCGYQPTPSGGLE